MICHRVSRIGTRYYQYDENGNLTVEQEWPFNNGETGNGNDSGPTVMDLGDSVYVTDRGWGMTENIGNENNGKVPDSVYRRDYRWNERNLLAISSDNRYSVLYTYGADGERSGKFSTRSSGGSATETLYFNRMWTWRYDGLLSDRTGQNSKHIYLGETRLVTKIGRADGSFTGEEKVKQYWYHSDHLGSAQLITNVEGEEYERIEYTPYGELWVEKASAASNIDIPYRFTGKERDEETGLYYYGARYLDPKTSRWLSTDPALSEYIPGAPINEEAKKRNSNLPGMGGVFNTVNLHLYHYAGNNPIVMKDPDGESIQSYFNVIGRLNFREVITLLFSFMGLFKGLKMNNIASEATNMTRQNFDGRNGWRNKGDAFRHSYWMARSTQDVGEKFTRKYGDSHEYSVEEGDAFMSPDIMMDIHNNDVGIEVGRQNPNASPTELAEKIKERIANGDMLIMNPETGALHKSNDDNFQNPIAPTDMFIRRRDESQKIIDSVN